MLSQLLIIVFSGCLFCVNARICEDVVVRNEVAILQEKLANCTVVEGNLEILLIEIDHQDNFDGLSFPQLTEIRGYLLIYRIAKLRTLSHLFPNLSIIRGLKLFRGYSLVLHDVFDLTVIGLPNLKYMLRGSTRIQNSDKLCYVATIDWASIGEPSHKLDYYNTNTELCEDCPEKCNGLCWSQLYCQKRPAKNCHPECLDCTEPNAPDKCIACRNYKTNETCVNQCPIGKVRHAMTVSCLTLHQCSSLPGTWWPFKGDCVNKCPKNYNKIVEKNRFTCEFCEGNNCRQACSGIEINSLTNTEILNGCTHMHGSLDIRTNCKIQTAKLFDNLAMIREIDGYLKIHRSSTITSLNFLKNLKTIHGHILYNDKHAVIAFENKNLRELWERNHTVEVKKGTIYFHDNPKLCFSEIEKFAQKSNLKYSTKFDASRESNGDNRMCNYIELNVTVVNVTRSNASFVWENVTATKNLKPVIGYTLCYTENRLGNISYYENHEEYYEDLWDCTFVTDIITHHVRNLKPFTEYAYYLSLYISSSPEEKENEGLTKLQYFKTLSDYPSELRSFKATSTSSDSVTLSWELPLHPNGILDHYKLVYYAENDNGSVFTERNFCKTPYIQKSNITLFRSSKCCDPFYRLKRYIGKSKLAEAPQLTCDTINMEMTHDPRHGTCRNFMFPYDAFRESGFVPAILVSADKKIRQERSASRLTELTLQNPSITTHTIQPFKHFTMLIFLLKVCNQGKSTVCSSPVMAYVRVLPKKDADDIPPGFSVKVLDRIAHLTWPEPIEPNTKIVAYELEYYKRNNVSDLETVMDCITRDDYVKANHTFQIFFPVGLYAIRIRAVSLAGPGSFSPYVEFEIKIPKPAVSLVPAIVVTTGIIGVVIFLIMGVRWYRSKHRVLRFLANSARNSPTDQDESCLELTNPNDLDWYGPICEDEFLSVRHGYLKGRWGQYCMIKTIREENGGNRSSFLSEIEKFKKTQSTTFVLKLFKVVTKGPKPLAIFELPQRSLKQYLQTFSKQKPVPQDLAYRMAAQIADGMAFLHSKNIIHKDLAARNCVIFENNTVKVGEYGISQHTYKREYNSVLFRPLILPLRWMSPDWMNFNYVPTTSADVWSYGMLLWEIENWGQLPFANYSDADVLEYVKSGLLPRKTPPVDLIGTIMNLCWERRVPRQTTFGAIVERFRLRVGWEFSHYSFHLNTPEVKAELRRNQSNPPVSPGPVHTYHERSFLSQLTGSTSTSSSLYSSDYSDID